MRPARIASIYAIALAALVSAHAAHAQAGVYALFTGASVQTTTTYVPFGPPFASVTTTGTTKIFGPTFGLYADFPTPLIKFGGDVRGTLLNGGGSQLYQGFAGPRLEVDLPLFSLKPYVEELLGGGRSTTKADTNPALRLNYIFVAGVDRKLGPLIEWRVLEFTDTHVFVETDTPTKSLSTGLVLRIP